MDFFLLKLLGLGRTDGGSQTHTHTHTHLFRCEILMKGI